MQPTLCQWMTAGPSSAKIFSYDFDGQKVVALMAKQLLLRQPKGVILSEVKDDAFFAFLCILLYKYLLFIYKYTFFFE